MGYIGIRNLEIFAYHGVYQEEKDNGQKFYISADLRFDTWEAEHTDHLEPSVNYGDVCEFIKAEMLREKYNLIEHVASVICEALMKKYKLLDSVSVRVNKPSAPIPIPFENVFAETERQWTEVYLGIGSNMGDKMFYIRAAVEQLKAAAGIKDVKLSELIETEPYGYKEQDRFLNGCVYLKTWLPPEILLEKLQEIERSLNRERKIHWGPRTIDLDILLYGETCIHRQNLCVPHIDMQNRMFVLAPLNAMAPYAWHPVYKKTINELYNELKAKGENSL